MKFLDKFFKKITYNTYDDFLNQISVVKYIIPESKDDIFNILNSWNGYFKRITIHKNEIVGNTNVVFIKKERKEWVLSNNIKELCKILRKIKCKNYIIPIMEKDAIEIDSFNSIQKDFCLFEKGHDIFLFVCNGDKNGKITIKDKKFTLNELEGFIRWYYEIPDDKFFKLFVISCNGKKQKVYKSNSCHIIPMFEHGDLIISTFSQGGKYYLNIFILEE